MSKRKPLSYLDACKATLKAHRAARSSGWASAELDVLTAAVRVERGAYAGMIALKWGKLASLEREVARASVE